MPVEAVGCAADAHPGSRRRALLGAVALLLLPAVAQADGFVLVHGGEGWTEARQQRRATAELLLQGAEAEPESYQYLSTWAAEGDRWITTVPAQGCRSGAPIFDGDGLAKLLDGAETDAQFGKFDRAAGTLDDLIGRLGCATGEPTAEQFYALWFLRGAVAYQQGATGAARRFLARAALVPGQHAFDESWPPALHELLAEAKLEIVDRPRAPLVVLHPDAVVRVDGAVLNADRGRVVTNLTAGVHVVQVTTPMEERTFVLDMEGIPLRPELPAFAMVAPGSFEAALTAVEDGATDPLADAGRALLLAEAASRDVNWMLVAIARDRGAKFRESSDVLRVDPLAGTVTEFSSAKARSDRFASRARIAFAFESRSQGRGADEEGLNYLGGSVTLWGSLAPVVRVGATFTIVGTNAAPPQGKTACCALPSVDGRLRLEFPKGIVRPYGELAIGILWPDGDPGIVSWSLEGGGGVVFVPGAVKRVGINVGALAGNVASLGGYLKLRVAAEVRF